MDAEDAADIERFIRDKRRAEAKNKLSEVAQLCNCIGEIYSKYGHYEEAIEEHTQERNLSEALNDKIGEAIAFRKIGECHCALGHYSEALELQKKHLTLARECGNHLEEQRAWATIGRTYLCQTESKNLQEASVAGKKAEKAFVKALELCEKIKPSVKSPEYMAMKGRLYLNLGHVFDARGDVKTSADMLKRAITIAEKFKLDEELFMCNSSLAAMYQKNCQYNQALRFLLAGLKLADKLRDKVREKEMFIQKAKIHVCFGDFLAAKHCLKKAHKFKVDSETSEKSLIKIFCSVNKMQEVAQDLETERDERKKAKLLEVLADCSVELGNFKEAIENYLKVLQYTAQLTNDERAAIYMSLGQTYADIHQYDDAILYYRLELEERKDNYEQKCQTLLNIADLEELKGSKYAEVCTIYMSAFEASKKAKSPKLQIQTLKSLISLQKLCKQSTHLQDTEKKLSEVLRKYHVNPSPDSDGEDSENMPDETEDHGNISLSDLTVSEESDGEQDGLHNGATVGRKKSKLARRNEKGETPLHRACIDGNIKKVKSLIGEGHPINARDYCGWLPLHEACNHGHLEVVEFLLDHGAWINDRGGEKCGGVTPLIDSASCGHLDIVRLLVDRGANLMAKDDDGNTALDSLQSWYGRTSDMLEAQCELEYKVTESLLINKMGIETHFSSAITTKEISPALKGNKKMVLPGSSQDKIHIRLPDLTFDSDESKQQVFKKGRVKGEKFEMLKKKRAIYNSTVKKRKVSSSLEEDLELDEVHPALLTFESTIDSDNATHFYQSAINNVGTSAQKRLETETAKNTGSDQQSCNQGPALVSAEDDVGDNWLIEDTRAPSSRRKSAAATKLLTTSSVRPAQSYMKKRCLSVDCDGTSGRFSEKRSKTWDTSKDKITFNQNTLDILTETSNDSSNDICPVTSSTEEMTVTKPVSASRNDFWDSDDEMLSFVDTEDITVRPTSPVLCSRGKSSSLASKDNEHVAKSIQNENKDKDIFLAKTSDLLKKLSQTEPASKGEETTEKSSYSWRVKVKFNEQTLLVPIQPKDQNKTVSWLTHQAQQRYHNMFMMLPTFTLSTQDGTILCSNDIINAVLRDNDVLTANVISWERPRLEVRYEQACQLSFVEPNKNVMLFLKDAEATGQLQLSDLSLGTSGLCPVFQALDGQKTLTKLCLSGNRLGDSGLTSLVKVLTGLFVLKSLVLDTNNISADGIHVLSQALKSDLSLQSLTHLSLAHNCLGDVASDHLTAVLKNLPDLRSINISACSLTNKLFTSTFCDAVRGCKLSNINVAENQLKTEGLRSLLQSLHADCLLSLDISHTRTSCDGDLGLELEKFISDECCCLQNLVVAGCHWSHSDILVLNRLPTLLKTLRTFNVSQNQNITNKTLQKLLYLSSSSSLEELTVRGCAIMSPLDGELLQAFKTKMSSRTMLKKFILTCRGLKPEESSTLSDVWSQSWKNQSAVKIVGASVSFSISE